MTAPLVPRGRRVSLVNKDLPAHKETEVVQDHKEMQVHQGPKVDKVIQVHRVLKVLLA